MTGHHTHDHDHDDDHEHGPLEAIDHVHGGPSVLDIGGDIGALHVLLDDEWAGRELFLRGADPAWRVHTGGWVRHVGDGHVTTALFAELVAGTYWVLDPAGADACAVEVAGGELAEVDLRTAIPAR